MLTVARSQLELERKECMEPHVMAVLRGNAKRDSLAQAVTRQGHPLKKETEELLRGLAPS